MKLNKFKLLIVFFVGFNLLLSIGRADDLVFLADGAHCTKVLKGDTLQKISMRLFNTTRKWPKLFAENQTMLGSANKIEVGMVLKIPAKLVAKLVTSSEIKTVAHATKPVPVKKTAKPVAKVTAPPIEKVETNLQPPVEQHTIMQALTKPTVMTVADNSNTSAKNVETYSALEPNEAVETKTFEDRRTRGPASIKADGNSTAGLNLGSLIKPSVKNEPEPPLTNKIEKFNDFVL